MASVPLSVPLHLCSLGVPCREVGRNLRGPLGGVNGIECAESPAQSRVRAELADTGVPPHRPEIRVLTDSLHGENLGQASAAESLPRGERPSEQRHMLMERRNSEA